MSNADDNAYPLKGWGDGLTKRELLSAMAMQGLVSDSEYQGSVEDTARLSIYYADALLAELEKGKDAK